MAQISHTVLACRRSKFSRANEQINNNQNHHFQTTTKQSLVADQRVGHAHKIDAHPSSSQLEEGRPRLVIVLSGKRKSGKDHVARLLTQHLESAGHSDKLATLRIAGPIKSEWARRKQLHLDKLLDSSQYKEAHRAAMVAWSEEHRRQVGWGCFLEQAIREEGAAQRCIWMLVDARRPCDLAFFEERQDCLFSSSEIVSVRIEASEASRRARGWQFVEGIDDAETECGLDEHQNWSHRVRNEQEQPDLGPQLAPIFARINRVLVEQKCHSR